MSSFKTAREEEFRRLCLTAVNKLPVYTMDLDVACIAEGECTTSCLYYGLVVVLLILAQWRQ